MLKKQSGGAKWMICGRYCETEWWKHAVEIYYIFAPQTSIILRLFSQRFLKQRSANFFIYELEHSRSLEEPFPRFSIFKFFLKILPSLLLSSCLLVELAVCARNRRKDSPRNRADFHQSNRHRRQRHFAPPPWIIDSETISRVAVRK